MASVQVALSGGTTSVETLNAPASRVLVKQVAGTPAEVYATADGSAPVIPTSGVTIPSGQQALAAVLGDVIVLEPPKFGDHMVIPTIRLLSAGSPTVVLEW